MSDNEESTDPGLSAATRREVTRRKKRSRIMKSLGRNFIKIGDVFAKSVWPGR
jgi:hypothetical protein